MHPNQIKLYNLKYFARLINISKLIDLISFSYIPIFILFKLIDPKLFWILLIWWFDFSSISSMFVNINCCIEGLILYFLKYSFDISFNKTISGIISPNE